MPFGYPLSPRLLKGALVELTQPFLGPVPNVVVFQYNPESITRTVSPWAPPDPEEKSASDAPKAPPGDAAPGEPGESFTLDLQLDASDHLEDPLRYPTTQIHGVADRIAAIESLAYPMEEGDLSESFASFFGASDAVPRGKVPTVLFIWGPGRILPVRLDSLSVEEQAYLPTLYPVRAKVSVGLKVLTPEELKPAGKAVSSPAVKMAMKTYDFTHAQRKILARMNLRHSAESVLDMLPF